MNIQEINNALTIINQVMAVVEQPYETYHHIGSMGETAESLIITVKDDVGNVLFEGTPPCIGYISKSNYAHDKAYTKKPDMSVTEWLQFYLNQVEIGDVDTLINHLQLRKNAQVELRWFKTKDWMGSDREEISCSATFRWQFGMVNLESMDYQVVYYRPDYEYSKSCSVEKGGDVSWKENYTYYEEEELND